MTGNEIVIVIVVIVIVIVIRVGRDTSSLLDIDFMNIS